MSRTRAFNTACSIIFVPIGVLLCVTRIRSGEVGLGVMFLLMALSQIHVLNHVLIGGDKPAERGKKLQGSRLINIAVFSVALLACSITSGFEFHTQSMGLGLVFLLLALLHFLLLQTALRQGQPKPLGGADA